MRNLSISVLLLLTAITSSGSAFAEGKLSWGINGTGGFMLVNLQEKDGVTEGDVQGWGMNAYARSWIYENKLFLELGGQNDWLEITQKPKYTYYYGPMWDFERSAINYWPNGAKGFRINGTIVNVDFSIDVDHKKNSLYMWWQNHVIQLKKVAAEAGGCKGTWYNGSERIGSIVCHSSGSLEDAFFRDPNTIIGYLVHILVLPEDDDSWDGLSLSRRNQSYLIRK